MTAIITAMADVFSLVGKMIEVMIAEPVLLFFLASSLVPVGIGIFSMLKRSSRS